ncbi:MAG: CPCC family cysteine-rich protein [Bacilli bacterium]
MNKNIKQIKPMSCPVCDRYYFVKLDDFDRKQLGLTPNTSHCSVCGWFYDLEQFKDPNLKNESNAMSLNEYKEWYKKKIKENKKWEYYQDFVGEPEPHKCPVCGEYTFKDLLTYDICSVCGWEDTGFEDDPDEKPGMDEMTLNEHIKWFKEQRAKDPKFRYSKK